MVIITIRNDLTIKRIVKEIDAQVLKPGEILSAFREETDIQVRDRNLSLGPCWVEFREGRRHVGAGIRILERLSKFDHPVSHYLGLVICVLGVQCERIPLLGAARREQQRRQQKFEEVFHNKR